MEQNVEKILNEFEVRLKAAEQIIVHMDEQAEKRLEARLREKELEARILESKLKWRPKDWFILSGIFAGLLGFIAVLITGLILAFSYVPSNTTVEDVSHITTTTSSDSSANNTSADFIVE